MNIGGHGGARRVALAPGYVLHHYAYRDSSRIVEAFTAEHGRLTLFARGANSPKSPFKGLLQPFQRLLLSWTSRGEAGALVAAEPDGSRTRLPSRRLMSGFYVNELLLKLTERWDPHPEIFLAYAACVETLCAGIGEEAALRRFEKGLLHDLGYGLDLTRTEEGVPVESDRYYRMAALGGPQMCVAETPGAVYGRSLADLAAGSFLVGLRAAEVDDQAILGESKMGKVDRGQLRAAEGTGEAD